MENTIRQEWSEYLVWVNLMVGLGTRLDNLITDRFPELRGRDFNNPDSFTDEEVSAIFDWLENQ